MDTGGTLNCHIENNLVYGQILGNGNYNMTIFNNTIVQIGDHLPVS